MSGWWATSSIIFFVRYRAFESWGHLNQLAEQWLREEADQRLQGTVREVVADRFEREAPHLAALPGQRYDTAYRQSRQVSWDGYIEVRGNRYSVPARLTGRTVTIRIDLDEQLWVYEGDSLVTNHRLQSAQQGWVTVPEHHAALWQEALQVEQRPLQVYQEATQWS